MNAERDHEVTELLSAVQAGEADAWDRLIERVHQELHLLAHRQLAREQSGNVLQTTALVNEAYLRLVRDRREPLTNQGHFFRAAATAMRRILIDEARRRRVRRQNDGGARGAMPESLQAEESFAEHALEDIEALDRALQRLAAIDRDQQKTRIIDLRFFAGLTIEQTAQVLAISPSTVKRDWEFARAWLQRELERSTDPD